jgi:hypothetical protein
MNFKININNNVVLGQYNSEDSLINEAIDSTYINLEYFELIWNNLSLQINYRLDIADSFNAIIIMLDNVKSKKEYVKIIFPSEHFFEAWGIHREEDTLRIEWYDEDFPDVYVEEKQFFKEWLGLLQQIKEDLLKVGYSKDNLEDFHVLENLDRYL